MVPREPAQLLRVEGDPKAVLRWTSHEVNPTNEFAVTIAIERQSLRLALQRNL